VERGLQPERTALARRRTGLAVATASAVGGRALAPVLGAGAVVLGALGLALAALMVVGTARGPRGGGLLAVVAATCAVIGIAALVLVVAVSPRGH
jgi:hypothetical protein